MEERKLYKLDRNGNIRVWWMETNETETGYRSVSGVLDGKKVESGWIYPDEKNQTKSNATTVTQQVLKEIASNYEYQLNQGKYHESIDTIEDGSNYIECMLANKYDPKKHRNFPYIGQPKFDGARALGVDFVTLQTRKGKRHVSCPHILKDIEDFQEKFPDYILDGELYNHDLKDDFEKLMSMIRKSKKITEEDLEETKNNVFFYVYDVITPIPMTNLERIKFLEENVYSKYNTFRSVEYKILHNEEDVEKFLADNLENGYEGSMLRNPNGLYQSNRSENLLKHKTFMDMECEVVEINEGEGSWQNRAKTVVIKLPDGTVQESGVKGTYAFTEKIYNDREFLIGTDVTVKYQRLTADGKLKFPVITYWWKERREI